MRSHLAVLLAFTFLAPEIGAAQTDSVPTPVAKNSTPVTPKAPCPPVPGGQEIASADTAEMKKMVAANCTPGMAMSPEQLKQMQAQMTGMLEPLKQMQNQMAKQANGDPRSAATMQAMRARMAQMGPPGATTMSLDEAMKKIQAQIAAAGDSMSPGMAPGVAGPPGERGGKALEVSSDLPGDLRKGKTVIRNIDWIPGGGNVSPSSAGGFARAMAQVAAAMKQAGGSYRVDLYMDSQSGNIVVRTLGPQRLAAVEASLVVGGASPGAAGPQIGISLKDADPRLEIIRLE
jgi:hypothetical protein